MASVVEGIVARRVVAVVGTVADHCRTVAVVAAARTAVGRMVRVAGHNLVVAARKAVVAARSPVVAERRSTVFQFVAEW